MQVTPLHQKIKKANVPELGKHLHHVLNAQHSLIWVRDGVLVGGMHTLNMSFIPGEPQPKPMMHFMDILKAGHTTNHINWTK